MRKPKIYFAACPNCGHTVYAGRKPDPLSNFPYLRNRYETSQGRLVCPTCSGVSIMRSFRA